MKKKTTSGNPRSGELETAIDMLKADHRKVKKLFQEFEAAENDPDRREEIARETFMELEIHTRLEEEIFYPAVEESADEEGKKLVAEWFEEHKIVKTLIEEMQGLDCEDEEFEAKFKVLTDRVEHHIEEEEGEMLPDAEESLGEEMLEDLTLEMKDLKEQLAGSLTGTLR